MKLIMTYWNILPQKHDRVFPIEENALPPLFFKLNDAVMVADTFDRVKDGMRMYRSY
jgi:hypothetical protein